MGRASLHRAMGMYLSRCCRGFTAALIGGSRLKQVCVCCSGTSDCSAHTLSFCHVDSVGPALLNWGLILLRLGTRPAYLGPDLVTIIDADLYAFCTWTCFSASSSTEFNSTARAVQSCATGGRVAESDPWVFG